MIVLGMDTSTTATAVALALGDGTFSEARDDPPAGRHPGHATRLLSLAAQLLEQAGASWSEVGRIAVGAGPGTFTGLRVGVASARGLAQSLGVELLAVSSTAALALPALREGSPVLAAIDARRGEVFAALYGPGAQELLPPRALSPDRVAELAAPAGLEGSAGPAGSAGPEGLAGPAGLAGLRAVGDGALRYRGELERAGLDVPPRESALHLLRAQAVCALAALQPPAGEYQLVLPDYRRRPDAELARGGAG